MTIKQKAETLLTQYAWTQVVRNGVDCWIDKQNRTTDAIYLGPSGSIRKGANKSGSRPFPNGLVSLERYLTYIQQKIATDDQTKMPPQ